MKPHIVQIFLFVCVFFSCNNASRKEEALTGKEISKTVVQLFSDSLKADTFKVKLLGTEPQNMHLVLTIHSFKNIEIYNVDVKAADLFKNYDIPGDLSKKKNQIRFLKDEVDRFFNDENFIVPAITEQEIPDQNVPDKSFYEELKKSQLNGFIYRLGKENKVYIGWSEKEQKVKPYYNCCD